MYYNTYIKHAVSSVEPLYYTNSRWNVHNQDVILKK